jgi:hypothetical protein
MDVSIIIIFEFFVCIVPISRVACVFIIHIHSHLYCALCEQSFIQPIIICKEALQTGRSGFDSRGVIGIFR